MSLDVSVKLKYLNDETGREFGVNVLRNGKLQLIEAIDGDRENPIIHGSDMTVPEILVYLQDWINTNGIDPAEYRGADYGND